MAIKISYNFVPMPQEIWDNNLDLSLAEFRLLGYILRHTVGFRKDDVRLTDDELSNGRKKFNGDRFDKGCGVSINSIKYARESLIARDMLEVENKTYRAKIDNGQDLLLSKTDTTGCQTLTPKLSETDTQRYIGEKTMERQYKEILCSPTANEIDKDFSNWWQNYPKKQGKGGAEKAYKKARKIASAEALLAGARKWDRRVMAGIVDRQYVPMPQTWLNNKRWLDEDDNKPQTGTIGVYN